MPSLPINGDFFILFGINSSQLLFCLFLNLNVGILYQNLLSIITGLAQICPILIRDRIFSFSTNFGFSFILARPNLCIVFILCYWRQFHLYFLIMCFLILKNICDILILLIIFSLLLFLELIGAELKCYFCISCVFWLCPIIIILQKHHVFILELKIALSLYINVLDACNFLLLLLLSWLLFF